FLVQPLADFAQLPVQEAAEHQHRGDQEQHEALDLVCHAALGEEDVEAERGGGHPEYQQQRRNHRARAHGCKGIICLPPLQTIEEIPMAIKVGDKLPDGKLMESTEFDSGTQCAMPPKEVNVAEAAKGKKIAI